MFLISCLYFFSLATYREEGRSGIKQKGVALLDVEFAVDFINVGASWNLVAVRKFFQPGLNVAASNFDRWQDLYI